MAGFADAHGSGYHPMFIAKGGDDRDHEGGWWSGMWIFAIVIIFFALILIWRRDDGHRRHDEGGLEKIAALGMLNQHKPYGGDGYGGRHEIWDVERDQMREFANIRMEIKDTAYTQARESDRYFYEQRAATEQAKYETRAAIDRNNYDTAIGFKGSELLQMQQTEKLMSEINGVKVMIKDREIQDLRDRVYAQDIRLATCGHGKIQQNVYATWDECPPHGGYRY